MNNCTDLANIQSTRSIYRHIPSERLNVFQGRRDPKAHPLTDEEKRFLVILSNTLVMTPALMEMLLKNMDGEQAPNIEYLRKCFMTLSHHGYLYRKGFLNERAIGSYFVFSLGPHGWDFIKSLGRQAKGRAYLNKLDADGCKRLLSALQFVISQKKICSDVVSFGQLVIEDNLPRGTPTDLIFRSNAVIHDAGHTTFVESVRNRPGGVDDLVCKLFRMEYTLRSIKPLNIDKCFPRGSATVVVVCEDPNHMKYVMDELRTRGEGYERFDLYFTNDYETFHHKETCLHPYEEKKRLMDKALLGLFRMKEVVG